MLLALLGACSPPPPMFIDKAGIDEARIDGNAVAVCVGLTMKDEAVRTYAAERLATWKGPQECVCQHLERDGSWDLPVLRGLDEAEDDARVGCVAALLDKPALPDRPGLARALGPFRAPAVKARLKTAAKSDADLAVRAEAMAALRPEKDEEARSILVAALADPEASIRASAATALVGLPETAPRLAALMSDSDPGVRAAVLASLDKVKGFAFADVACKALAEDADPSVRAAAALTIKGSKDVALGNCLRAHMLEPEDSGEVRAAMLTALRGTPGKVAADTLCDAIPFWTKTYVGDGPVEKMGNADIVGAHNDRDFERSYECTERALKAGGYTCWQRGYLAAYYREFGGKVGVPQCGGGTAVSNEITF
ncbi:MAG: HEAT repeat domain-containing protein [Deltaproteobacteria bacterium]|nr:HEAT repeat domain-containing protein [Deltaproteobacteria bacterium]